MQTFFDKLFPFWRIRNVALFYVLSAVYNAWIVAGVWVFIWGRFMTQTQIGISDAFTFSIGLLVEIPSGVLADVIGRKKAIIIGNVLLTLGNFFISISSSFLGITGWYLAWTIGYAFQSGATEALVYDTLRELGYEKEWHRIISTATVIAKLSTLLFTALGGLLFTIWFRLPYMALSGVGVIGIVAALLLREIKVLKKQEVWSLKTYFSQMKDGFSTLAKKNVFPMAFLGLTVISLAYMYNWGLIRPLTAQRFGYSPGQYALLLSTMSFAGIVAVSFLPRVRSFFKLETLLQILGGLYVLFFFWMSFQHTWLIGGLIMILLSVLLLYTEITFSQFINLYTKSEHRATTLSAVALFTRLPYVLLALLIGRLADDNLLPEYTFVVGGIAMALWTVSFILQRKYVLLKSRAV